MINVHVKEMNGRCFGVAYSGKGILATAVGPTRQGTLKHILRSLPAGVKHEIVEEGSEFALKTITLLRELESGGEQLRDIPIAIDYVAEPLVGVLKAAAAIPVGYVTSYGNVARASNTEPRVVGRVMASNPLYPIVPCHRVVGADLSLVGYRGSSQATELQAKLDRLSKETRGWTEEKEVLVGGRKLKVYPVEWVIKRARKRAWDSSRQRTLFE